MKCTVLKLKEINGLSMDDLTVAQVRYYCETYGLCAVCNDGKLLGFEREEANNA